jgi:hypothetical protein
VNPTDSQLHDNGERAGKKAYRKPNVQIYGSLSEITQHSATPGTHRQDGGTVTPNPGYPFVPNAPNNRS